MIITPGSEILTGGDQNSPVWPREPGHSSPSSPEIQSATLPVPQRPCASDNRGGTGGWFGLEETISKDPTCLCDLGNSVSPLWASVSTNHKVRAGDGSGEVGRG